MSPGSGTGEVVEELRSRFVRHDDVLRLADVAVNRRAGRGVTAMAATENDDHHRHRSRHHETPRWRSSPAASRRWWRSAAKPSCPRAWDSTTPVPSSSGGGRRNQAAAAPGRTVLSVKRLMGSGTRVRMGDDSYTPQEISAFILKALKERADRALGRDVHKAVITVPAYFTDAQRQATREAGEIAGLNVVRIINEPTAAALSYESGGAGRRTLLVYDMGGGTFDVSVVRMDRCGPGWIGPYRRRCPAARRAVHAGAGERPGAAAIT